MQGRSAGNDVGVAAFRTAFDERDNVTAEQTEDATGALCLNGNGYARLERSYDAKGNLTEDVVLDVNGKPAFNREGGYSRLIKQYDRRNRCMEERYFDEMGDPCSGEGRVAGCRLGYDLYGNVSRLDYFDGNNDPCPGPSGFSRLERGWNRSGVCIDRVGYDAAGRLLSKTVPFLVVDPDGEAYGQGMRNTYLLLGFCDWSFGDPCSTLDDSLQPYLYRDPKGVVLLNGDMRVETRNFGSGPIGTQVVYQQADSALYAEFAAKYEAWKASSAK